MINKFRLVHGGNSDDPPVVQCLKCTAEFSGYFGYTDVPNIRFCPYCGTKWDEFLESRPHNYPRWAWDLFGPESSEYYEICRREYEKHQANMSRAELISSEDWAEMNLVDGDKTLKTRNLWVVEEVFHYGISNCKNVIQWHYDRCDEPTQFALRIRDKIYPLRYIGEKDGVS